MGRRHRRASAADIERMLREDAQWKPCTAPKPVHAPVFPGPSYDFAERYRKRDGAGTWRWFSTQDMRQRDEARSAGLRPRDIVSVLVITPTETTGVRAAPSDVTDLRDEPMRLVEINDTGFVTRDRYGERHPCNWGQAIRFFLVP